MVSLHLISYRYMHVHTRTHARTHTHTCYSIYVTLLTQHWQHYTLQVKFFLKIIIAKFSTFAVRGLCTILCSTRMRTVHNWAMSMSHLIQCCKACRVSTHFTAACIKLAHNYVTCIKLAHHFMACIKLHGSWSWGMHKAAFMLCSMHQAGSPLHGMHQAGSTYMQSASFMSQAGSPLGIYSMHQEIHQSAAYIKLAQPFATRI